MVQTQVDAIRAKELPCFYHVYVGVILCYDLLPKSDLKSCHHPPPTSPTSLVPPHLPKKKINTIRAGTL